MLKVVGASWYKTKVSSLIILGALLLAIGALFILNIERPVLENVYCATAYWTPSAGYRIEFWGQGHRLEEVPRGVARICYKSAPINSDSVEWPHMEIESNPNYPDHVQAYSAGILEGSLLWKSIYLQWTQSMDVPCSVDENSSKFCEWLRVVVEENYTTVKARIEGKLSAKLSQMDSYWYQIHLFYQQLEGIEFGWRIGLKRSPMKRSGLEIPIIDILILNLGADLKLLEDYYNKVVLDSANGASPIRFAMRQRQAIQMDVKEEAERINLSLEHQVHDSAMAPYRVLKKYKLNYRLTPAAKFAKLNGIVPGHDIVLTSYSGVVSSPDDFYAITGRHSRITVAGIDLKYDTRKLQDEMDLQNAVFLSARVMAANRLATSSRTWAKLMKRDPHAAKQWVLVDRRILYNYNSLVMDAKQNELVEALLNEGHASTVEALSAENNKSVADRLVGLVWIVDNVPNRLHGEDETERIIEGRKLYLEGIPHFAETGGVVGSTDVSPATDPGFEYLKQSPEGSTHSVRFYALAPGRSEYTEGMTVIHGAQDDDEDKSLPNFDELLKDSASLVESEGRVPALTLAGFSSKWAWT